LSIHNERRAYNSKDSHVFIQCIASSNGAVAGVGCSVGADAEHARRPGVYLINTYDLPSRPLYSLTALTLHESAPGHAFQMPIAMEHTSQPEFRQHTYISAFGEGWALYCEKLGEEMGMYDTPYDRFGMLGYQIWRAARCRGRNRPVSGDGVVTL
jgi:uncharacterized protein (DUF885 family)